MHWSLPLLHNEVNVPQSHILDFRLCRQEGHEGRGKLLHKHGHRVGADVQNLHVFHDNLKKQNPKQDFLDNPNMDLSLLSLSFLHMIYSILPGCKCLLEDFKKKLLEWKKKKRLFSFLQLHMQTLTYSHLNIQPFWFVAVVKREGKNKNMLYLSFYLPWQQREQQQHWHEQVWGSLSHIC